MKLIIILVFIIVALVKYANKNISAKGYASMINSNMSLSGDSALRNWR